MSVAVEELRAAGVVEERLHVSAEVASWDMFCQSMGHFQAVAFRVG